MGSLCIFIYLGKGLWLRTPSCIYNVTIYNVTLEESVLHPQSTKAVYDRILDLRIATPQIIINYGLFLEEHSYFEESFKVSWPGQERTFLSSPWQLE